MNSEAPTFSLISKQLESMSCDWISGDLRRWGSNGILGLFIAGDDLQAESRECMESQFECEISILRTLIAGVHSMAISLAANKGECRIFPIDWIHDSGCPNADLVMAAALCQLGNYVYSAMDLSLRGLANPARVLARSTLELCQILTVIVVDRESFRSFVTESKENESRNVWYRLFSEKNISPKLAEIERQLGLRDETTRALRKLRKEEALGLSEAVHHSYMAMVVGTLSRLPNDGGFGLGVLGGVNDSSEVVLRSTLVHLMQFLQVFRAVLLGEQRLPGKSVRQECWENSWLFIQAVHGPFMQWLKTKVSAAETDEL